MNTRRIKAARQEVNKQERALLDDLRAKRKPPLLVRAAMVFGWLKPYMAWLARWEILAVRSISRFRKRASHINARTHRGVKKNEKIKHA